jgi:GntR family transcriptional regulator
LGLIILDYIFLNKSIKTSIYRQIASSITKAIEDKKLKYNDKLPTEKEICEVFDISQTAVKMAYNMLISEHKIKRIKGKGTFVTNRETYISNFKDIYKFEREMKTSKNYQVSYLLFDIIEDDYAINRILKLDSNTKCHLIYRVISKDHNPVLSQKIYLPDTFFPKLNQSVFQTSALFDFIEKAYTHKIKNLHNTFSPIKASSAEAQILNILPNEAIYWIRTQIIDDQSRAIGYLVNYFPGEFTEFEVTVHAKH